MKSNYAAKMQQFADECSFIAAQVKLTQNDSTTESGKIFQYVVFILLHGEFFIFWCTLIIGCFGARSSSNAIFLNARKLAYATVQPVGFTFTLQARTIASFHTTPTHVCMRNNAQRAALGSKKKNVFSENTRVAPQSYSSIFLLNKQYKFCFLQFSTCA